MRSAISSSENSCPMERPMVARSARRRTAPRGDRTEMRGSAAFVPLSGTRIAVRAAQPPPCAAPRARGAGAQRCAVAGGGSWCSRG